MTELEQHLITSLERLEADLKAETATAVNTTRLLEERVAALERHAPELETLCTELENTLRRLNSGGTGTL